MVLDGRHRPFGGLGRGAGWDGGGYLITQGIAIGGATHYPSVVACIALAVAVGLVVGLTERMAGFEGRRCAFHCDAGHACISRAARRC